MKRVQSKVHRINFNADNLHNEGDLIGKDDAHYIIVSIENQAVKLFDIQNNAQILIPLSNLTSYQKINEEDTQKVIVHQFFLCSARAVKLNAAINFWAKYSQNIFDANDYHIAFTMSDF